MATTALVFNSDADGQDVVSTMNDICNTDNNSYTLKAKARDVNTALEKFYTLAFHASGQHSWDDPNKDTVPVESINLVSGTQSYNLDDFTSEIINILRVECLDDSANAMVLKRLQKGDLPNTALTEFYETSGTPIYYDLVGEYIYLYPKPNYSETNGLVLYVERAMTKLASTATTTTLPVPGIFSRYICNKASYYYLAQMDKSQANRIKKEILEDEVWILDYFSNREKGVKKRMTMNIGRFR